MQQVHSMLTVDEVAEQLGVTRRRVGHMLQADQTRSMSERKIPSARKATPTEAVALLESRRIKTIPHGGIWVIDQADILVLQQRNRKGGRPSKRKGQRSSEGDVVQEPLLSLPMVSSIATVERFDEEEREEREEVEGAKRVKDVSVIVQELQREASSVNEVEPAVVPLQQAHAALSQPGASGQESATATPVRKQEEQPAVVNKGQAESYQHGVISAGKLLQVIENRWREKSVPPETSASLDALCQLAVDEKITHLWVLDAVEADDVYYEAAASTWDLWANWTYPPGRMLPPGRINLLSSASGFRRTSKGGARRISIIFPKHAHIPWRWVKRAAAREALLTILYLERALEIPITASAPTAGIRLLEKMQRNGHHPEWLEIPKLNWDLLPFRFRDVASDLIAERPLLQEEYTAGYLHKIDKNGAYLRACVTEMFGVGAPELVKTCMPQEKRPGIWRCSFDPISLPGLPAVWDGGAWIVTPILQVLRNTGHDVLVHEGYVWNESHGIFKRWAETLWNARQGFRLGSYKEHTWKSAPVSALAEDACKQIATATIGLTSYRGFETETAKYRPDWKAQIVGSVRARMFSNLLKFQQEQGSTPIIIYIDAIYVLSNESDINKVAGSLVDKPTALGGFKPEWSLPVTDDVRLALSSQLSIVEKLEIFNRIIREGKGTKYGTRKEL